MKKLLVLLTILTLFQFELYAQELWGMTATGGSGSYGVIFQYNSSSEVYTIKHNFDQTNGGNTWGSLVQANNGKLYGMAGGGSNLKGVIFEYDPNSSTYTKKMDFDGTASGNDSRGALMQANNGKLYGMTSVGGTNNFGVLFEYDPTTSSYTKKIDFDGTSKGKLPYGSLIQASNGKLYGVTNSGGTNSRGALFEYDPSSDTFTKKVDFDGTNKGSNPICTLVEGESGKLYGMTQAGGASNKGIIFEYNTSSSTFTNKVDLDGTAKGSYPRGSLMLASNGKLYGMTSNGGVSNMGVVFEYDPSTNSFTKKVDFDGADKGKNPEGSLVQDSDGVLFGMTYQGGANDAGVLFEYNISSSTFTKKIDFSSPTNGTYPHYTHLIEVSYQTQVWSGSIDNDWHTTGNWEDATVPIGTMDVLIPDIATNYPTITSAAYCNRLTMYSYIENDASLIGQEFLTTNESSQIARYISTYTSASDGWHFLSSPVSNEAINGAFFKPVEGLDDIFDWDEASDNWYNYYGDNFSDTEFEVGKGYLVAYSASTGSIKGFTGSLNTNTVTKNLSYSAGQGDGWNLLGNPYPSAIDWDLITKSGDVNGSVYIVNPTDGSYLIWNGSAGDIPNGEIALGAGFFVKANSAGQSVTMEVSDQVHSDNTFNKSSEETTKNLLKISLKGEGSNNNTYIQFREDATAEFDHQIDAYKLFGFAEIAQVYTEMEETQFAINCLSYSTETVSVPLVVQVLADEALEFNFTGIESFDASIRIDLEDLKTGEMINIRSNPVYVFQASTADEANRFILHFNGVTAVENLEEAIAPLVYSFNDAIYIQANELKEADVFVYNINGQLVGQDKLKGEALKRLHLKLSTGVYLVRIQSETSIWNQKVYIK